MCRWTRLGEFGTASIFGTARGGPSIAEIRAAGPGKQGLVGVPVPRPPEFANEPEIRAIQREQGSVVRGRWLSVRGQRSEVRGQRSEVRGQRSEVRGQRSEVRGQRSEVRGQRSEV